MEFHVLYFQDTYSEHALERLRMPKNKRVVYSQIGVGGGWSKDERVKRSQNDFPSFFLNLIRLIDAPDRNGAINLVSISIMAMLREKMRMATRKGTIGVEGGRKGVGCRTRELRFRTIVPNGSSLSGSYGTDCGLRMPSCVDPNED